MDGSIVRDSCRRQIIRDDINELSKDLFERSTGRKYQVKMSEISGLANFPIIIDIIQ